MTTIIFVENTCVAVLVTNGEAAEIAYAVDDFRDGIETHLRQGIHYPIGTPLSDFNVSPEAKGDVKIEKIAALYRKLFRAKVVTETAIIAAFSESPNPVSPQVLGVEGYHATLLEDDEDGES